MTANRLKRSHAKATRANNALRDEGSFVMALAIIERYTHENKIPKTVKVMISGTANSNYEDPFGQSLPELFQ